MQTRKPPKAAVLTSFKCLFTLLVHVFLFSLNYGLFCNCSIYYDSSSNKEHTYM